MTAKLLLIRSENGLETRQDYDGIAATEKGAANGVAGLDESGRIPSGQLPSYVDDVLEYSDFSLFPATGETGKIYLATGGAEANKTFRWSGSIYVEISASLALGETSATAYRGDRGKTAYDHSQATGNPHGTTAADVGALAKITLTGAIDSHAINGGAPGLYELRGSSYVNFPGALLAASGGTLLQTVGNNGRILQELHSELTGKMIQRQTGPSTWSGWTTIWDDDILPVSTTGLAVVSAANQAAARAAIGLSQTELLIHSDFGRSATTDVWQSAFTDNAASGLQFAANTIANGTKLIIEQALSIPADGGGATYQVYIGPQLTGEQAPTGSTYAIAISPNIAGQNGTGTLRIEIELLGSGASITGHVTSTFSASGSNAPWVNIGTISVDGTQANSLDVRFNPDATTSYVIRRSRVRRVNP